MKDFAKKIVKNLPVIRPIVNERNLLRELYGMHKLKFRFAPGHFYSPISSLEEVKENEERIFSIPREIPGVELHEEQQLQLLDEFQEYYDELPFEAHKTTGLLYFYENDLYYYSDAIFLHCMLRHMKPRRIVEIGCGYSSCMILDTNELFFDNSIQCTFIDPFPKRFLSLVNQVDLERIELIEKKLQDVPVTKFDILSSGDFLFIDSTHVSKVGSDVNYVFFEILPRLDKGVYIHFHDIFYPFEYPKEWIYEGVSWNEIYLLRAFLQYNQRYEIVFFNTFLEHFHKSRFLSDMPLCMRKINGGSLWIRKK